MLLAAKTTSQVLLHMSVAFGVMYAFTGSVVFGGIAAIIEPVCMVVLLPLHDRLWRALSPRKTGRTGPRRWTFRSRRALTAAA
jgi:uncharacterized membrane protein